MRARVDGTQAIAAAYPTDADAPALAAAARMNLRPWEHWTGARPHAGSLQGLAQGLSEPALHSRCMHECFKQHCQTHARLVLRHHSGPLTLRTPVEAESVVLPALRDINTTLERRPGHPMATHLLIHLAEAATPGSTPAAFGFAGASRLQHCCA